MTHFHSRSRWSLSPRPTWWHALLPALILSVSATLAAAQADEAPPPEVPVEDNSPQPFTSSLELLQSLGVDDSHLRSLMDGEPLGPHEQEPLLRVLQAIRRFSPADLVRWAQENEPLPDESNSEESRGQIYALAGNVVEVVVEQPLPEVIERFAMKRYYRCRLLIGPAESPVTVYALAVPKAWPIDTRFSERVSLRGFFLKLALGPGDLPEPVFAAQRIAWHPTGVLGDLKMDMGLFDDVRNRAPIGSDERECFYEMLSAVGRTSAEELFSLTRRPPDDDYSVVPLFNDPEKQHGKLVGLTGTARRAMLIKLDPNTEHDIISRFGLDHYYQIEIFTADSQSNPLVYCVRELPPGMPEGPRIYETVRIPGFFFKTWSYRIDGTDEQPAEGLQLAPMLIGRQPQWIPRQVANNLISEIVSGCLIVLVVVAICLIVWNYNRGDKKFRRRTIAKRYEPETERSLNELNLPASQGPDFSKVD